MVKDLEATFGIWDRCLKQFGLASATESSLSLQRIDCSDTSCLFWIPLSLSALIAVYLGSYTSRHLNHMGCLHSITFAYSRLDHTYRLGLA